jgi:molybdopterin synthase sulfur carrier subunit
VNYRILYFASLRDAAGRDAEDVTSESSDARTVYGECKQRHAFALDTNSIRVAVNGEFADWNRALADRDEIAFLPPVSGG